MTNQQLKEIAKAKYGREISDEMATNFLLHNNVNTEEELHNVISGTDGGCGPNDPTPTKLSGTVRYFKLTNKGGFVAQMKIKWTHYTQIEEGGNIIRKKNGSGSYELSGYRDICLHGERTIDMKNTDIPDGSEVYLEIIVCGGYDRKTKELYIYSSTASDTASYKISGTTCSSNFKKV